MNIIAKHEVIGVFAVGDIHGQFNALYNQIVFYDISNVIIFLAGDVSVGFRHDNIEVKNKENKTLKVFNAFLKKRNIIIYAVRGNHDNPLFYDGNHNFSNIVFMKDYDIVDAGGVLYLGIGGAISVDRKANHHFFTLDRIEGVDWWKAEVLVCDEKKISEINNIDVIIAHTSPEFAFPTIFNNFVYKCIEYDAELKNELPAERELMGKIYNEISKQSEIKYFIYGHFHKSHFDVYNNTKFKLLDIGEFYEIKF